MGKAGRPVEIEEGRLVVTLWGKAWTATAADADALPPPRAREDLLLASWLPGCIGVVLCALCVHVLTGGCLWGDVHVSVSAYASVFV